MSEQTNRVADMTPDQLAESIRWNVFMGIFGANVILGFLLAILAVILFVLK